MAENVEPIVGSTPATPVPATPAVPVIDPKMIQEAVKNSMGEFVREARARQAEAQAAKDAEDAAKLRPSGLDEMFRPHLEPALNAARAAEARALLAADSAEFYTNPKMVQAVEFREKIEEVVQAQAKRGNLISRKDAWNWLRGGDLYDTLQTRSAETQAAKIKEAQAATATGPGVTAPKFTKAIDEMNTDELGAALKDVRF